MRTLSCATIFCFNLGVGSEGGQVRKKSFICTLMCTFWYIFCISTKKRRNIFFFKSWFKTIHNMFKGIYFDSKSVSSCSYQDISIHSQITIEKWFCNYSALFALVPTSLLTNAPILCDVSHTALPRWTLCNHHSKNKEVEDITPVKTSTASNSASAGIRWKTLTLSSLFLYF